MTSMRYIRERVFQASQTAFAEIAGTTQPTVVRWEHGRLYPDIRHLARIRDHAKAHRIPWSDSWFFERGAKPSRD